MPPVPPSRYAVTADVGEHERHREPGVERGRQEGLQADRCHGLDDEEGEAQHDRRLQEQAHAAGERVRVRVGARDAT